MFDIITFGSATQDIILTPKHVTVLKYDKNPNEKEICFPMGSKIDIKDIQFNSGGGGTNTAATFANQGFKTAFCGVVGEDVSGQEIIDELKKLNINTSLVQKTDKKRTNHSVVILNHGSDRTILAYRGAAELMNKENIPFKKLKTAWLYLAPLTGLLCDSFLAILEFAFKNGIKVAANPSMAQLSLKTFGEIARSIDVLIMNQEEASFLTKIPSENEKETMKWLIDMRDGITVVTKGGNGVVVSDGKYIYTALPPAERKIVDTTGAGDSFASGFLSDYIRENGNIEKSIQLGIANSVGNLSQIGAKTGLLKKGQEFERVEIKKEVIVTSI